MKKSTFILTAVLLFAAASLMAQSSCGTVKDYEGNTYRTVQIGSQCWMAEELRATIYSDGSSVSYFNPEWGSLGYLEKDFCYYKNDHSFGKLYTWGAVVNYREPQGRQSKQSRNSSGTTDIYTATSKQGLCPIGWHIPSQAEWEQLRRYLSNNDPSGSYASRLSMIEGWSYWTSEMSEEESAPLGFRYRKSNEWSFEGYKGFLFARCVRN